ncbi:MAG: hypothetical protein ALECFALPRED_004023 [Alectoria fallacina]|uniref:G domain-containing protein n=1 Tax=Alectoria fallacina TaxID=1903189 RepID=A0A8H3EL45_9LECA|nr:MAG: hypothetical protein ALECFALPRED_004023 [Alectoria fallacina]
MAAIVAFLGMTGAGKSTIIKLLTDSDEIVIGDSLRSCTASVQEYEVILDGIKFTLVDTPGFDDPFRSNEEILEEIARWFAASYEAGRRLAGIVYLHRITDTRMLGSSMLNFGVFQRMTGPACSDNIVLGTTFWDSVDEQLGVERQLELQTVPEFWGSSFDQGSKIMRMNDKGSITQLLHRLAGSDPVTLKIQDEMITQNLPLHETEAGIALQETALRRLHQEHNELLAQASSEATQAKAKQAAETDKELKARQIAYDRVLKEREKQQKHDKKDIEKAAKKATKEHEKVLKLELKSSKKAEAAVKAEQVRAAAQEKAHSAEQAKLERERHIRQAQDNREASKVLYQSIGMQLQWLKVRRKNGKVSAKWTNRDDKKAVNKAYTRICNNCRHMVGEGLFYRKLLQQNLKMTCQLTGAGCKKCRPNFIICKQCSDNGWACTAKGHSMVADDQAASWNGCSRVRDPPNFRSALWCNRCTKYCGEVYFRECLLQQ